MIGAKLELGGFEAKIYFSNPAGMLYQSQEHNVSMTGKLTGPKGVHVS